MAAGRGRGPSTLHLHRLIIVYLALDSDVNFEYFDRFKRLVRSSSRTRTSTFSPSALIYILLGLGDVKNLYSLSFL